MASTSSPPYDEKARADLKQWLEHWKIAGTIMDANRVAYLRKLDDAAAARMALDLWSMADIGTGDSGEGLEPMTAALRLLASRK